MINIQTKVCCLIGNPVQHSISPAMHNAGYEALGLNFVYIAFRVNNLKKAISGIKAFSIHGVSVTVPYKVEVIKYLDEIDKKAKEIGAVNTIVNSSNGVLKGYNFDCEGGIKALKEQTAIAGKRVFILGAGGAARALAIGLKKEKAKINIISRRTREATALSELVNAESAGDYNNLKVLQSADILINATPLGMYPNIGVSPVKKDCLHEKLTVFDAVYNPKETRLIKEAKEVGCKIIYGYKMLLYQATVQFEHFTGKKAPTEVMEKILLKILDRRK